MTPRDPIDWRSAPPISEEYRALMDAADRAVRNAIAAQLGYYVHAIRPTEECSVIPSTFHNRPKEPCS